MNFLETIYNELIGFLGIGSLIEMYKSGDTVLCLHLRVFSVLYLHLFPSCLFRNYKKRSI